MLDRLVLFIPFKRCFLSGGYIDAYDKNLGGLKRVYEGEVDLRGLDVKLVGGVRSVDDGRLIVEDLRHPYETIGSDVSGMAFKVYARSGYQGEVYREAGVELRCSPAKLLQGHNVYGPTSIELGFRVMLMQLKAVYPKVYRLLDRNKTEVLDMDCTYSARLDSREQLEQCLVSMAGVNSGQTKARGSSHLGTVYWGSQKTRLKQIKAYDKEKEFYNQLKEAKRKGNAELVEVLEDEQLQEHVKNVLRKEVTVKKQWFLRRGLSNRVHCLIAHQKKLQLEGRCFIHEVWQEGTRELFKALKGVVIDVLDDEEIKNKLNLMYVTRTRSGKVSYAKANRLYIFYCYLREQGFDKVVSNYKKDVKAGRCGSRSQFYRDVGDLVGAGISRLALQKLNDIKRGNVRRLINFEQLMFHDLRPKGYVEPSLREYIKKMSKRLAVAYEHLQELGDKYRTILSDNLLLKEDGIYLKQTYERLNHEVVPLNRSLKNEEYSYQNQIIAGRIKLVKHLVKRRLFNVYEQISGGYMAVDRSDYKKEVKELVKDMTFYVGQNNKYVGSSKMFN